MRLIILSIIISLVLCGTRTEPPAERASDSVSGSTPSNGQTRAPDSKRGSARRLNTANDENPAQADDSESTQDTPSPSKSAPISRSQAGSAAAYCNRKTPCARENQYCKPISDAPSPYTGRCEVIPNGPNGLPYCYGSSGCPPNLRCVEDQDAIRPFYGYCSYPYLDDDQECSSSAASEPCGPESSCIYSTRIENGGYCRPRYYQGQAYDECGGKNGVARCRPGFICSKINAITSAGECIKTVLLHSLGMDIGI